MRQVGEGREMLIDPVSPVVTPVSQLCEHLEWPQVELVLVHSL